MRRLLVLVPVLALLFTAACSSTDAEPGPTASSSSGSFPATVTTAFGDITVEQQPKRVVALGWGDAETALAFGVQPVGASDWLGFGGTGVGPWATDRYTADPKIIGTLEPSYEEIAALAPDLILDTKSSGDQDRYDKLSQIATTVGIPEDGQNYLTTLDQQTTLIGAALGVPDRATALLAEVDQTFADAAAAHPEFKGKTVTVAAYSSDGWGAYISSIDRTRFMYNLGFVPNPTIEKMTPERFSVRISDEQLDLLDADLLVVQIIGKTAAEVEDQSLFQQIPAVRDGRSLILDDPDIAQAFSMNSPLSIQYAVDQVAPLASEKVDG